MPKKSAPNHPNNGHASKQSHAQKSHQEESSNNKKLSGYASSQKRAKGEEQRSESGYRQQIHAKKLAEGNKSKSGCLPKLFMLLLPFMAVGAYLWGIS